MRCRSRAGLLLTAVCALGGCGTLGKGGVARSDWMDEASVQVHSVSDQGTPLVGGGLLRRVTPGGYVGGRALLPFWGSGSYSGELLWRSYLMPNAPSSLFLEGDAGLHLVRKGTTFVPAAGFLFGVRAAVTDTVSIGGSFGPVLFPKGSEPDVDYLHLGPFGLAPRMLASVDFHL